MKKSKKDIELIETKELYESNISTIDAADFTRQSVTLFGVNVSVARGCPSLYDGLTPVVRNILWYMYHDSKLTPDKRYKKALEFINPTTKYHPHGDQSISNAFENVVKTWENNVMYIEMDGNEGSVAGDDTAALRYLDARMSQYAYKCFFEDFDPSVIEMTQNYLRSDVMPVVLPAKYPNFLVNLTTGIGWGNSFVKVPFNLNEAFSLVQSLIEYPEMEGVYLFPDSPRGYDIIDDNVIKDVCATGAGTVRIRARMTYHEEGNYILVTGFPERTTMDQIIKAIGKREERSPLGIKDIADKTNLENVEFWIKLKKGVDPQYVITELYNDPKVKLCSYAQILLNYAGRTKMLSDTGSISLKEAILKWLSWAYELKHRTLSKKLVALQKTQHKLSALIQLKEEGILDGVFEIVKTSETDEEIIDRVREAYGFTSYQAETICNLQIRNQKKASLADYQRQYDKTEKEIVELRRILTKPDEIKKIIWNDLEEGKKLFGKPRQCAIIKPEDTVAPMFHYRVVITKRYVKRLHANGTGVGFLEPDDDVVMYFPDITSVDYLHIGTDMGEWCYLPIDKIPAVEPSSKGMEVSLLLKAVGQVVAAVKTSKPSIKNNKERYRLYCFTSKGLIKATPLTEYATARAKSRAITLNESDRVCYMGVLSDSDAERLVYTKQGFGIILQLNTTKSIGRLGKGQRIIKIGETDEIQGLCTSKGITEVCIITKKGYAKIVQLDDAFIATKVRQTMLELTRLHESDEVLLVQPILKGFYESKLILTMQSGEKTEIDASSIRLATRHAKCYKVAPVRKGDSIIRVRINS